MNIIKQQNQEAAQSYITAEEFEDFKVNILGILHEISEDLTRLELKSVGDNFSPTEKEK